MSSKFFKTVHFVFLVHLTFSQEFLWNASIDSVRTNGYHKILLDTKISALSKSNFSDLRLFDQTEKEVPYIINSEANENINSQFHVFEYPPKNKLYTYKQTKKAKKPQI